MNQLAIMGQQSEIQYKTPDDLRMLIVTIPVALERGARGRGNRLRYLSRARNFINENPGAALSLERIALAVETSPRTLEVAFREALNVTVVQYIKYSRLNAVRRQLLKYRGSQVKVKSVALDHGFWHLGRFAQDYYSLFNEHPSQTLGNPQPCPDSSAA